MLIVTSQFNHLSSHYGGHQIVFPINWITHVPPEGFGVGSEFEIQHKQGVMRGRITSMSYPDVALGELLGEHG